MDIQKPVHRMVAFTPSLILEFPVSPQHCKWHQEKHSDCYEKRPPARHIPVHTNRVLRWGSAFGFNAQIVPARRYPRKNCIIGPAAFRPGAIGIASIVVLDL